MRTLLFGVCILGITSFVQAEWRDYSGQPQTQQRRALTPPPQGQIKPNAYGPGVNSDATGRPFKWQPQGIPKEHDDPLLKVKPNVFGPGTGIDQYGRPVQAEKWP